MLNKLFEWKVNSRCIYFFFSFIFLTMETCQVYLKWRSHSMYSLPGCYWFVAYKKTPKIRASAKNGRDSERVNRRIPFGVYVILIWFCSVYFIDSVVLSISHKNWYGFVSLCVCLCVREFCVIDFESMEFLWKSIMYHHNKIGCVCVCVCVLHIEIAIGLWITVKWQAKSTHSIAIHIKYT